jgi:hypothetical protein
MKHLIPYLQDDQKAADYLRQVRWPDGVRACLKSRLRGKIGPLGLLSLSRLSCKCIQGLAKRELWHKRWKLRGLLAPEARQA